MKNINGLKNLAAFTPMLGPIGLAFNVALMFFPSTKSAEVLAIEKSTKEIIDKMEKLHDDTVNLLQQADINRFFHGTN